MQSVGTAQIVGSNRLTHIVLVSVPAMNEAVDAVLKRPFDFPVGDLGIFLVVVTHQGRSFGILICKVIERIVKFCSSLFPRRIIVSCNDSVGSCRFWCGDILFKLNVIHIIVHFRIILKTTKDFALQFAWWMRLQLQRMIYALKHQDLTALNQAPHLSKALHQ